MQRFKKEKDDGQNFALVILSEKLMKVNDLVEKIQNETGWDTRATVLGHIQRGGIPTAMERVNATRMGYYAVQLLEKGITGVCVGLNGNKLVHQDIYDALKKETQISNELIDIIDNLN